MDASGPTFPAKEQVISTWLATGRKNLAEFQRSPFHDTLTTPSREFYASIFEDYPFEAIKRVENLLNQAREADRNPRRMSGVSALSGCWTLGTGKTPRKVKFAGSRDYAYRFIPAVLSAVLLTHKDIIRHRCHNRSCVCPDHLTISDHKGNRDDEQERRYGGGGEFLYSTEVGGKLESWASEE